MFLREICRCYKPYDSKILGFKSRWEMWRRLCKLLEEEREEWKEEWIHFVLEGEEELPAIVKRLVEADVAVYGVMPEMEFGYHTPLYADFLTKMLHVFMSLLGVFAVQYFLSFHFKGFLIPASIGIIGFVVGIIVESMDNPLALYFLYTYPAISQNHDLFIIERIPIVGLSIVQRFLV